MYFFFIIYNPILCIVLLYTYSGTSISRNVIVLTYRDLRLTKVLEKKQIRLKEF